MGQDRFCFICASRPVNTCCCGCSLFCSTITLAIFMIIGGALNILVAAVMIASYRQMTYSDSGLIYYADSSNLDTLKGKLIAIYSLELVYSIILFITGILGTMSQSSNYHNAKRFYYSYLLFVIVYEFFYIAIIIIYGSMVSDITDKDYYDKRINATVGIIGGIVNVAITTLIQTYFLLVIWSNWQKKEYGNQNISRVGGADIIILQQQPVQMQQMSNQPYQPYQNSSPYQPQVQMYQPQVQMMNNYQPQIQEAVVFQNDFSGNLQSGQKKEYY